MKRTVVVLLATAALALSGCSSDTTAEDAAPSTAATPSENVSTPIMTSTEPTPAAPSPAADGQGPAYQLVTMGNATVTFDVPANPADPLLADIESFRQDAGAAPVSYIIAEVDNRDGTETVNMYKISAYDADGNEYEFTAVYEAISNWGPSYTEEYVYVLPDGTKLDEATGSALSDRKTTLHNAYLDNVDQSQKGTMILVSKSTDLPSEFVRVGAQPSGMGEQQNAVLASEAFGD